MDGPSYLYCFFTIYMHILLMEVEISTVVVRNENKSSLTYSHSFLCYVVNSNTNVYKVIFVVERVVACSKPLQ